MGRLGCLVTVVGMLLAALAVGGEEAPKGDPAKQTTVVRGTVPQDLTGRWLVVGWVELPGGKARTTTALWEIGHDKDQLTLTRRFVTLPSTQRDALAQANADERAWHPSPDDLAQLAAAWGTLPAEDPQVAAITHEIIGRDGFDEAFTNDPKSKGALWAVRQALTFARSAAPAIKEIDVFSTLAPREQGFGGNYVTATIAAAPFPIPITLTGSFGMYRLGAPRARGRLLDFFSGCGR